MVLDIEPIAPLALPIYALCSLEGPRETSPFSRNSPELAIRAGRCLLPLAGGVSQ